MKKKTVSIYMVHYIRFLIQATQILDKHIDIEGLFRKSGSVARQKELKVCDLKYFLITGK